MLIIKNKAFHKWAIKEDLADAALLAAVNEMERGLIDVELGGHVVKKRIAVDGRGKSGGFRTIIAYIAGSKVFFVYGFAKNTRANISATELKALKYLAKELLGYSDTELNVAIKSGVLIEVENDG